MSSGEDTPGVRGARLKTTPVLNSVRGTLRVIIVAIANALFELAGFSWSVSESFWDYGLINRRRRGIATDDELLLLGQFDFDPGTAASACLVARIEPLWDQAF